jgi:hypothetical protein
MIKRKHQLNFYTILLLAALPAVLCAQTADQLETLLQSRTVTFQQAAWFVLEAADIGFQDAFALIHCL